MTPQEKRLKIAELLEKQQHLSSSMDSLTTPKNNTSFFITAHQVPYMKIYPEELQKIIEFRREIISSLENKIDSLLK